MKKGRMIMEDNRNCNRVVHFLGILALFLAVCVAVPVSSTADDSVNIQLEKLESPPEIDFDEMSVDDTLERNFHLFGIVDFVNKNRIVIGDAGFELSPDTSLKGVKEGAPVGVVLDAARRVVVVEPIEKLPK